MKPYGDAPQEKNELVWRPELVLRLRRQSPSILVVGLGSEKWNDMKDWTPRFGFASKTPRLVTT